MVVLFVISLLILVGFQIIYLSSDTRGNDVRTFGKFAVIVMLGVVIGTMIWMGVRLWLKN